MSNAPKNASEKAFQEEFVRELEKYSWTAPDELDGNKHKVTVNDLIQNWRKELNRLNSDILEAVDLTDNEFNQVLSRVKRISNSYEASTLLVAENGKGKIEGIYRDNNPKVTKKSVTLTIFRRAQVNGGDSSYKVAREVVSSEGNRFDLVLLICGLPLINIEMKRSDKNIEEAFGQFVRYSKDGEYKNNFMAFSQMMVITSKIVTEYFATPKSHDLFNRDFCFYWTDEKNNPITDWKDVIATFLKIPMAHQMVGDYLVINTAKTPEESYHMLMRPYQVYALQNIEFAAKGIDNPDHIPHGGYVWHTTGSGKTVTSFKTALFLATKCGFDKVVFLVDRRELDENTTETFNSFSEYEAKGKVHKTKTTNDLKRCIKNSNGIIITTTYKLHSLVKKLEDSKDTSIKENKIVFIIDEAHRTTMGNMMKDIKAFFAKNGLFFGFTGTPLFEQNKTSGLINEENIEIKTTRDLFGPSLHEYRIDEAIRDQNVLGFNIDYINTGEFRSYEDLREELYERLKNERPDLSERDIERKVQEMDNLALEKECKSREIILYQDETHIPQVVSRILEDWESQSQGRLFNAILTTGKKARAIAYWREFKKQQENKVSPINIAVTFSFGNENDVENIAINEAEELFKSYEEFTEQHFAYGDKKRGEKEYFNDLISRAKRGGSKFNSKNIDLVIVADQLLTGYDSKFINTLYVDKNLELQGLVQAYSRTNRLYGPEKEFGTIVNFMWPAITEEKVKTALILYGSGDENTPSSAIVDTYDVAVRKLNEKIHDMFAALKNPSDWILLKNNNEGREIFNKAYRATSAQFNKVKQYYEFCWNSSLFGIDEDTWLKYIGAYRNLNDDIDIQPDIIRDLKGKTKIEGHAEITSQYILSLIGNKRIEKEKSAVIDGESLRLILEKIQELSDLGHASQADMLRQFLNEIQSNVWLLGTDPEKSYIDWKDSKLKEDINVFSNEWGVDKELLYKSFLSYDPRSPDVIQRIDEIVDSIHKETDNPLKLRIDLMQKLPDWMKFLKRKYSD